MYSFTLWINSFIYRNKSFSKAVQFTAYSAYFISHKLYVIFANHHGIRAKSCSAILNFSNSYSEILHLQIKNFVQDIYLHVKIRKRSTKVRNSGVFLLLFLNFNLHHWIEWLKLIMIWMMIWDYFAESLKWFATHSLIQHFFIEYLKLSCEFSSLIWNFFVMRFINSEIELNERFLIDSLFDHL